MLRTLNVAQTTLGQPDPKEFRIANNASSGEYEETKSVKRATTLNTVHLPDW
jgi:hypothetical protein